MQQPLGQACFQSMIGECGSCTYFGAIASQEWWKGPSVALSLQGPGGGEVREGAGADRAQGRRPDRDQVRVLVAPTAPLRNLWTLPRAWTFLMWGKLGRNWTVASGPCVVPVTRHSEVKVLYLFVLGEGYTAPPVSPSPERRGARPYSCLCSSLHVCMRHAQWAMSHPWLSVEWEMPPTDS